MRALRGRSLIAIIALVAAALPASVIATAAPAGAAFGNPVKILPLGDSITRGIGDPNLGGYRSRLEDELVNHNKAFDFVGTKQDGPSSLADRDHEGIGGKTIGEMSAMFDLNKSKNPDIVLLIAGTNDMGTGWETAHQRLANLIDYILGYSSVDYVVVGTIPPRIDSRPPPEHTSGCPNEAWMDPRHVSYNNAIKSQVVPPRAARVKVVDMYPLIKKYTDAQGPGDMADCRHPDASGYEKMGAAWYTQALAGLLTTVPTAPRNVSAVAGNGQATVSFSPPSNNGGAAITEYTVTSTPGGKTKVGAGSPLTVTGLTNGTSYTFKVKAKNSAGYGPESVASSAVTPTGSPPPTGTYLSNLTGTKSGTGNFWLDRTTGGPQIKLDGTVYPKGIEMKPDVGLTYNLGGQYTHFVSTIGVSDYCGTGGVQFKVFLNGSGTATYTSAPSLKFNDAAIPIDVNVTGATSMKIQLDKTVTTSDCYYSDWADARLLGSSNATAPTAPTIGTATAGQGSATVRWTPPTTDGGSPITAYIVYRGDTTANPVTFTGPASTQTDVTGLTNGTSYQFTVRAQNAVGLSNASALSNPVTPQATVPSVPRNVAATAGDASATVTFQAPTSDGGAAITRYKVYDGATELNPGSIFTASPINLTGLVNGQTYNLVVKATNSVGEGLASSPPVAVKPDVPPPPTVPGAPTNVQASPGNTQATVSFTAPPDNGAPITRYKVYDGATELNPGSTFTTSPINLTGLVNGQTYNLVVKATNSVGEGLASSPSVAVTPTEPSATPIFLGDLTPASASGTRYWRNKGTNAPVLKILGVEYTKGVQVDPGAASTFTLTYNLPGSFSRFQSDIGVDANACGPGGNVRFKVFQNGDLSNPIYNSDEHLVPPATSINGATNPTLKIDIDISGATSLTLRVEKGAAGCNYSDWADAKLLP